MSICPITYPLSFLDSGEDEEQGDKMEKKGQKKNHIYF